MLVAEEVRGALAAGRPVVALESTIIAHGLPRPRNLEVAREIEAVVGERGAVPATIAGLAGEVRGGLDEPALERLAASRAGGEGGGGGPSPGVARGGRGGAAGG